MRHDITYIISFRTRHNESINDDKTTIFTHRPRVSLARFTFCLWRHNRLPMMSQWPGNCDASTRNVASLDIDFIQGYIHRRWCKITVDTMVSDKFIGPGAKTSPIILSRLWMGILLSFWSDSDWPDMLCTAPLRRSYGFSFLGSF